MIVARTLRRAGFGDSQIQEAADGTEALEAILASPPDLVLSDWNMGQVSGIDLLRELRKAGATVRFGFVTSESTPEMRQMAETEGALFFIQKPFTEETFRSTLTPLVSAATAVAVAESPRQEAGHASAGEAPLAMPTREAVGRVLSEGLGQQVTVKAVPAFKLDAKAPATVAAYRRDDGLLAVAFVCELPLACSFGAALGMIPPVRVDECLRSGKMDGVLSENFHEVLNISAHLFHQTGVTHVALREVLCIPGDLPADVRTLIENPPTRLDLEIDVPKYRSGKLSIQVA
jgi:two-component system chemotaxis response regulator CheY